MGAWGNKLFDDDTACDVRDEYVRLLSEGLAGPAATDRLLDRWKEATADADEGPVFWLALAVTQHKHGRLERRVKERALAVLDEELGLDRWREIGHRALKSRLRHLEKVRVQLQSPQPKEKYVAPPFKDSSPWQAGDVIGYRLKSGQLALFGILGTETHTNGISPVCELLDWRGSEPPPAETITSVGACRGAIPPETLLTALAATYPEYAANPMGAHRRLLADMGLIEPARADADFDFSQIGAVTDMLARLKTGERKLTASVIQFARDRKPALLEPVIQFSVRRELKRSEMPARRVQRLKIRRPVVPELGEWIVIRWYELDEALNRLFGVE
jgi:hypothetical protein